MRTSFTRTRVHLGVLLSTLLVSPALAKKAVPSEWSTSVVVDGSRDEWDGPTTYFKGPELHVAVRNDADSLYVCMSSLDPRKAYQAIGRGLTLRLDPEGGKPLRIRFPPGLEQSGERHRMQPGEMMSTLGTFVVYVPGSDEPREHTLGDDVGIELDLSTDDGSFVYEARIPLRSSAEHPYGIGVDPGGRLVLSLDAPDLELELEELRDRRDPELGGYTGRPGSRGQPGGGMGDPGGWPGTPGGPGLYGRDRPAPMRLKMKVELARSR